MIVGLCEDEVKLLGPVHCHPSALVAPPVKVKVLPAQIGLGLGDAVTPVGTLQPMQPKATQVDEGELYPS